MPEFEPGEQKTAIIPMTNPTAKAFDYQSTLYMGTDLAVMSEVSFHLEAGEEKDINMPVTMPTEAGVYPVNIGVFSNGQFIEPVYHAEDVVIVAVVVPWGFSNISCPTEPSGVGAWYQINYSATITNIGNREVTKTVTLWRKAYYPVWTGTFWTWEWGDWYIVNQVEVTLAPGQSYPYNSKDLISYDVAAYSYLADSDGYESAHCYTPMVPSGTI